MFSYFATAANSFCHGSARRHDSCSVLFVVGQPANWLTVLVLVIVKFPLTPGSAAGLPDIMMARLKGTVPESDVSSLTSKEEENLTFSAVSCHLQSCTRRSIALTEQRNVLRIASKRSDVGLNPIQCKALVQ